MPYRRRAPVAEPSRPASRRSLAPFPGSCANPPSCSAGGVCRLALRDGENAGPETAVGVEDQLGRFVARAYAELRERRREMALDGALRHIEFRGDLPVRVPEHDHPEHLL